MGRTPETRGGVPAGIEFQPDRQAAVRVWAIRLSAGSLILLGALIYANTLSGPFLFDDQPSIVENRYIRELWPPWRLMLAPPNAVTTARPLVSVSLAINYAVGGLDVRGYHVVNIAVHLLATLVLFGIVRRSLLVDRLRARLGYESTNLAFITALLWMAHPMQTESVNYLSQRTESMMGLFYLLTLYCAIRSAESPIVRWWPWPTASVLACAAGVASKQVIVTAPVIVAMWDWAYSSEPYVRVFTKRWRLYAALAGTWVLLGALMWVFRDTNVGAGVSPWDYARAQCIVVVEYLQRAVWPTHLLFDYGLPTTMTWTAAAPYAAMIVLLLAATAVALVRQPTIGFLAAWVFIVLAPTSSFVPLGTEVGAERRMYLPLAGVVAFAVITGYMFFERIAGRFAPPATTAPTQPTSSGRRWVGFALIVALAGGLGGLTGRRNAQYRRPVSLWSSVIEQNPQNWRAHNNLGVALEAEGRPTEAIAEYRRALDLNPRHGPAHHNLAKVLYTQAKIDEAILHYRVILDAEPTAPVHTDMAVALEALGKIDEATQHYLKALQLDPDYADAHFDLGRMLFAKGDTEAALRHYREALRTKPDDARIYTVVGTALASEGKVDEAIAEYRRALEIAPESVYAHYNLGSALLGRGHVNEAIDQYRRAVNASNDGPEGIEARRLLARALASQGRIDEATVHYRKIFELAPDTPAAAEAHRDFADLLLGQKMFSEAIDHYRLALQRLPEDPRLHFGLGVALGLMGHASESVDEFEAAVRLAPDWPEALIQLANGLALGPRPTRQDLRRAVAMAERAATLTDRRNPSVLRALEMIYSAASREGRP